MKDYNQIQNFVNNFVLFNLTTQPNITDLIPFDLTAFVTAKQIVLQNSKIDFEENIQLTHKAEQLMRVLQRDSTFLQQTKQENYVYSANIKRNNFQREAHVKDQKQRNKANSMKIIRQQKMEIKIDKEPKKQPKNKKTSEKSQKIYRNENIDESNMNQSIIIVNKTKINSYNQTDTKIVELNKKQYKKDVPQSQFTQMINKNNQQHKKYYMNNKNNQRSQILNQFVKQNSRLIVSNSYEESEKGRKIKINQFQLPHNQSQNITKSNKQGVSQKIDNKSCQKHYKNEIRSQQVNISIKQSIQKNKDANQQMENSYKPKIDPVDNRLSEYTQTQINLPDQMDCLNRNVNNQKKNVVGYTKNVSENRKQILLYEEFSRIKFQEKRKEQIRLRQIQAEKLERQKDRINQIQQRQKQDKKRELSLLRKLKEQFSEICYQEPTSDEKRVSEQIKQLQIKLNQIITCQKGNRNNAEAHSPSAKIVKLNLTPSRNNLHKNVPMANRSPRSRSPVSHKTHRLLSKRIQNLDRN